MPTWIAKLLWFTRLTDDDGKLSLTNIAVWITLGHLVVSKNLIGPTDLGSLIASIGSYQLKRFLTAAPPTNAAGEPVP